MELVEGVELIDFINMCKRQADPIVRYIFQQIGSILQKLHGAKFAHRDLKPENVMVTKELKLKVIDLGFAADLSGRGGSGYTVTRKGTRMYMAPEIEEAKVYQNEDIDVFAFGTMLFVAKCVAYPW